MQSPILEALRERLREIDNALLLALDVRARFPRHPRPRWPETKTRLPQPPLDEILMAISPAGTAEPAPEANNLILTDALLARQNLAVHIAEAKADLCPVDVRAAMETGDRDKLLALLTDLPAELRLLEYIRRTAAEIAPNMPVNIAPLLWREYIIPWTKQSEIAHLLEP